MVSVLNNRHALIDFEKGVPIIDVLKELHGTSSWGELEVMIGCLVSAKHSLMNIFQDEEERCQQRENSKNKLQDLQQVQQNHREQLGDLVKEMQNRSWI